MLILAKIQQAFLAGNDMVVEFNEYLASHFGKPVQLAVDWVLVGLALVLVMRLFKFSFDTLRYVVVPAVLVCGGLSLVTDFSFLYLLPFAMGIGTILMLFKT